MSEESVTSDAPVGPVSASGADFHRAQEAAILTFKERSAVYGPHLFTTRSKGLSTAYRKAFPEELQQHNNCSSCRQFFDRFGHLVFITPDGLTVPAFWDPAGVPLEYREPTKAVDQFVRRQGVAGYFWTQHAAWGEITTEGEVNGAPVTWAHYHLPEELVRQVCAEEHVDEYVGKYGENFQLLEAALARYPLKAVQAAIGIAESIGQIAESHVRTLKWFHGVVKAKEANPAIAGARLRNFTWRAVAEGVAINPTFPRIGTSVIAARLLDPIIEGKSTAVATRMFREKIDPAHYRQQTAAPTAGAVEVARKRFADMGLDENDLNRRVASMAELPREHFSWLPKEVEAAPEPEKKMFGSVKTKADEAKPTIRDHVAPAVTMTWAKFERDVLPGAITMKARPALDVGNFYTITAPVKEDAGIIWWYDSEETRNPFAWFTESEPVPIRHYGMSSNTLYDVVGVSSLPATWTTDRARSNDFRGPLLMLEGLKDTRYHHLCLFPQLLRPELKEVERVIVGYGSQTEMINNEVDPAIGLRPSNVPTLVRVESEFGLADYIIDRLE